MHERSEENINGKTDLEKRKSDVDENKIAENIAKLSHDISQPMEFLSVEL